MPRIQIRRDTAANWALRNPVLASGEPTLETDTRIEKIGDGVTAYNLLPAKQAGGIEEAPEDGNQYARKDGGWEEVAATGGGGIASVSSTDNHIQVDNTDPANPSLSFMLVDNENLLTDAELAVVQATSGTNTGDQTDYEHIFFASLSPDYGVITRPYNFKVSAKTDTGGTAAITTSADTSYSLNATVTAGDYLKVTGDTLNMRSSLKVERA